MLYGQAHGQARDKTDVDADDVEVKRDVESELLRYRRVFETASDGIFILDAGSGEVIDVNRFLLDLLGYARDEIVGKRLWELSPFKDVAANQDAFSRLQESGHARYEHLPLENRLGKRIDVEFISSVYRLDGGEKAIQCNVRDIGARKALEQWRADFLAMLTHDIRNPLSAIYGMVELLRETDLSPEGRMYADHIASSAETVLSLVSNYLDLSKIEHGHYVMRKEPVDLHKFLSSLVEPYVVQAAKRSIALTISIGQGLPAVSADPLALERIFANLLHNALKFTSHGGTVAVIAIGNPTEVSVMVVNSGGGISADELPMLFQRYQQTAAGRLRGGAGMGLFVVKALTEAHGGSVTVESAPGLETRFTVRLPTVRCLAASV